MWAFLLWTVLVAWGTSVWLKRNTCTPVDVIREGYPLVPPRRDLDFELDQNRSPRGNSTTAFGIQRSGLDSRDGAPGRNASGQERYLPVSHL